MEVINYIGLVGYFILTCVYLYFSKYNTENSYVFIGAIMITLGYCVLSIEKSIDIINDNASLI